MSVSESDLAAVIPRQSVTAFAPASVGNVAVGFDVLGHSIPEIGDRVTARRTPTPGVRIVSILGTVTDLPKSVELNTAGKAVQTMVAELQLSFGIELEIVKGIPIGSGLGGSAASAVASVVAANALLPTPLSKLELLKFAMRGEEVASGSVHTDNIAPSLFGGLVLTVGIDTPSVKQIPVPPSVRCVLVHPHLRLSTREARQILCRSIDLPRMIWQSANLAGFLAGCFTGDLELIRASLEDVIIEPQRQLLIPGFTAVKAEALKHKALGCSISGAGPTIFAWCEARDAQKIRDQMMIAFAAHQLASDAWVSTLDSTGARVID